MNLQSLKMAQGFAVEIADDPEIKFTHPDLHRSIIDDDQGRYELGVFGQDSIRFYDDHIEEDELLDEVP